MLRAKSRFLGIAVVWVALLGLSIGVAGCGRHGGGAQGSAAAGGSGDPNGGGGGSTTTPNWFSGSPPTAYPSPYPWWAGPPTSYDPRNPGANSSLPPFFPTSTLPNQRYPGWPGQSTIPMQTTPTQQSVPVPEFTSFACTASVAPYSGSDSTRKVLISVNVSTADISTVWVQVAWGDNLQSAKVNLNPVGQAQFPLSAPGTKWPKAAVFAMSDLRPNSQMCTS